MNIKHLKSNTPLYKSWSAMKSRCSNKKSICFKYYGGRGITYTPEWETFDKFYKEMGLSYKKGLTLDRINNDKGYCKENCRWVTKKVQAQNRRNVLLTTIKSVTLNTRQWSKKLKINHSTICMRLKYGWTLKEAIITKKHDKYHKTI